LCEACNHTKENPGWTSRPRPGLDAASHHRHTIELTTPTGHTYHSTAPPLPGTSLSQKTLDQPPPRRRRGNHRRKLRHRAKILRSASRG
ncbi:HNH endonuclease, partial [Arthrobacter sp. RHLT1-20]